MANPYTSVYMPNGFLNDQTGLSPVFQNIGAQQAFENQQIQQGNQLASNVSQAYQNNGSMNPLAMAQALRQGNGNVSLPQTNSPMMNNVSGMGGSTGTGITYGGQGVGITPYSSLNTGVTY